MVGNAVTVCLSPDWSLKERLLWYLVGGRDLLYCIQCIALPCFVQCS